MTMLPILWKAEAQEDLTAILTYIAQRNRPAALSFTTTSTTRSPNFPITLSYAGLEELQARANWLPTQTMSSYIALKQAQ